MNKTNLIVSGLLAATIACEAVIIYRLRKTQGVLKIDLKTNKDKDIYRLEIDDLDSLSKKKYIILKVDNEADLSQH